MQTFHDLNFKPKEPRCFKDDVQAKLFFDNGYGVSVIRGPYSYGGEAGLYELAVLDCNGDLCYSTPVTDDVVGHLTGAEVTELMKQVQKLPGLNATHN